MKNVPGIPPIEAVWATYGEVSAGKLRRLTHQEYPWLNARKGLLEHAKSEESILVDDMRDYYSQFVVADDSTGGYTISPIATSENKSDATEATILLRDDEGNSTTVAVKDLCKHFETQGEGRPMRSIATRRLPIGSIPT